MDMEEKIKARETARGFVYGALADAYRLMPGLDLDDVLEGLESALIRLESKACAHTALLKSSPLDPEAQRSLEIDFAALFLGPFMAAAPPNGSVYLEDHHRLMGNSTVDVNRHYRSAGFDLSPDFLEAPDHVCAELEFMHVLIHREISAIDQGDYDRLLESLQQQRIFLKNHLGAWIPEFTGRVMESARTDYYRNLAAITQIFLVEEMESLPDLPGDNDADIPTGG